MAQNSSTRCRKFAECAPTRMRVLIGIGAKYADSAAINFGEVFQGIGAPEHLHSRACALQSMRTPEHAHPRAFALQSICTPEHARCRACALQSMSLSVSEWSGGARVFVERLRAHGFRVLPLFVVMMMARPNGAAIWRAYASAGEGARSGRPCHLASLCK